MCSRPLTFFGSLLILFFILDDLSCPIWSSSLKVDLSFSLYYFESLSFTTVSLTWGASGSSSKLLLLVIQNNLQLKFSCMIRNISLFPKHINLIHQVICHTIMQLSYHMLQHSSISCTHMVTSIFLLPQCVSKEVSI